MKKYIFIPIIISVVFFTKIHIVLAQTPSVTPTPFDKLTVIFKNNPNTLSLTGLISQNSTILPAYGISASRAVVFSVSGGSMSNIISNIKKNDSVQSVYPNYELFPMMIPNDPGVLATPEPGKPRKQWYLFNTKVAGEGKSAWDISKGSPSIVVAVIDTGVDSTHPDLSDKFASLVECAGGPCHEVTSMTDNTELPHGTHVSGLVAASTNNGVGIAGTGYNTKLMVIKVANSSGVMDGADVDNAIKWATDHGARVINMSLGSIIEELAPGAIQEMTDAVNYAISKNVVVVSSAGNCGANTSGIKACELHDANHNVTGYATNSKTIPASIDHVISVAALAVDNSLASYSEHNDPSNSNIGNWISVAAPGGFCTSQNDAYNCILSTFYAPSSQYGYIAGTSQASPQVAGIAALILGINSSLTNDQVKSIIEGNANKSIAGDAANNGMVDGLAALSAVTPSVSPSVSVTNSPQPSGSITPALTVSPTSFTPSPSIAATDTPAPMPTNSPTPSITPTPQPTLYPTTPPRLPQVKPNPFPPPPFCPLTTIIPTPTPGCCSQAQLNAGYKCMPDCPGGAVPISPLPHSYSCLSPLDIINRNQNGCPLYP